MDETKLNPEDLADVSGGFGRRTEIPFFFYPVKRGDTLSKLAVEYHTTVQAICKLNNIQNASKIYVGQTIKIPLVRHNI